MSTPLSTSASGDQALVYQTGFANEYATEALPGALPHNQNSPQKCAYGLYAEQISGTAFTAPRHANRRSWTYRIRPAAIDTQSVALGSTTNASDTDRLYRGVGDYGR